MPVEMNIPASLKDIGQLADVLNQFKSEAVQVKLLDRLLSAASSAVQPVVNFASSIAAPKRRGRPPGSKNKSAGAAPSASAPARRGRPPKAGRPGKVGRPPGRPRKEEVSPAAAP